LRAPELLLIALLAGCGTASQPGQDRIRTDYALGLAPREAARCLARNAEQYDASVRAQIRETGTLVTVVRVQQGDALVAVAQVAPRGTGSSVTIWRSASASVDAGFSDAMADGC
jgi:hypothetical protein